MIKMEVADGSMKHRLEFFGTVKPLILDDSVAPAFLNLAHLIANR
jgi:hypothetical protein